MQHTHLSRAQPGYCSDLASHAHTYTADMGRRKRRAPAWVLMRATLAAVVAGMLLMGDGVAAQQQDRMLTLSRFSCHCEWSTMVQPSSTPEHAVRICIAHAQTDTWDLGPARTFIHTTWPVYLINVPKRIRVVRAHTRTRVSVHLPSHDVHSFAPIL